MAARWGVRAQGVADDACFAATGSSVGGIAAEFRRYGVAFRPAKKGSRIHGWQRMRTLLANAGKPDVPGLYVSRACRAWWGSVPVLPRDPRRPEDVDSRSNDHCADATRYGVLAAAGGDAVQPFDPQTIFPDLLPTEFERRWVRWECDHPDEREGSA